MNPGGDFGKKELSPALRNRFTEVWVNLSLSDLGELLSSSLPEPMVSVILQFTQWYNKSSKTPLSLRDFSTLTQFMSQFPEMAYDSLHEGLSVVLFDHLTSAVRKEAEGYFISLVPQTIKLQYTLVDTPECFGVGPYVYWRRGVANKYSFKGPVIFSNLCKILRALKLPKPILLEGPPGVGKTSVVEALGKTLGHAVTRINLSEETDMIDLLGCDLPSGKHFQWSDGVLLAALKRGDWVVLDELNL
eukprot:CAMPEP_0204900836 /NCGR_PEP_ID=MMETSP1397-20131031/2713_1 /ASSEMBLY_ACC=CAM_ASM_000891 /TAXON_ID=49980 /ORGANISM="Climacostomum Climacostomum virens, Strain Stock W-24" /LENGTH=245 /DNA_ID=CAMNT_0052069063 /DNA_START=55 /DNA_END=789 /DNA_ORIENTATION=-